MYCCQISRAASSKSKHIKQTTYPYKLSEKPYDSGGTKINQFAKTCQTPRSEKRQRPLIAFKQSIQISTRHLAYQAEIRLLDFFLISTVKNTKLTNTFDFYLNYGQICV